MTVGFEVADSGVDPRAGDVLVVPVDGGWQVMVVEDVVALDRLVPLGERGARRFLPMSSVMDSADPPWHGRVQLLVTLFPEVAESSADAARAYGAGTLGRSVRPVLVDAGTLRVDSTLVLTQAPDPPGGAAPE